MPSSSYNTLRASIKLARRIASRVDPNNTLTDLDEIKIRSYIILAHAAIEEFLETTSKTLATNSVSMLQQTGEVSHSLLALIGHYRSKFPEPFTIPPPTYQLKTQLLPLAQQSLQKHLEAIDKNHGIKIKSVNALMHPIGVELDRVAPGSMGALETLGEKRGRIAHNMGIRTVDTKSAVDGELWSILNFLKSLDAFASRHCLTVVQFS